MGNLKSFNYVCIRINAQNSLGITNHGREGLQTRAC